ncbi:AAA family ATPase [Cronobacter sakazakii]|uniref:AAA family ATPase n=1 Tax=Cronobacter sakazakii TaxID=28141 RepID=UPI001F1CC3F0|nr:AAA family ATPase [Cronobacter sakazakii]MDI9345935.1 AAA family ATPase [Cronobacter sakazakii]MDQ1932474.1 AAA family ATPase [Cronobacter sakazakii]MDQ1937361.1 AAA family ATPase [Cronobacter sakazakii]MDQ1941022.1 AAA family ATPase [Cronobacter sakazakii]MDQ1945510.1 AAA family ATPase [Cronobacter sakazakii]
MKIEHVSLKNFRFFEQLDVTFHPHLTVLTAPNGAGKTMILDAVRIALPTLTRRQLHPVAQTRDMLDLN